MDTTVQKAFTNKAILITDVFNIFNPDLIRLINNPDKYTVIIKKEDIVLKFILYKLFKNINDYASKNKTKVYFNPVNPIADQIVVYTKHVPNLHKIKLDNDKRVIEHFKFALHTLHVQDNDNVQSSMLNLHSMDIPQKPTIWTSNLGFTNTVNSDIVIQKLFGSDIYINNDTYEIIHDELMAYKKFKILQIVKNVNVKSLFNCSVVNLNIFDKNGFDCTQLPH
ncbi:hypothetical protein MrNuV_ORF053 [Macrobrachium rosenbergii nudivirus]|nr:hypothetical protein MrNuV_ORF053 [Macrobrachium rosenbergii nudivirus]